MEPILSKQEIAELLTSIKDGRGSEGLGPALSAHDNGLPSHPEISLFDLGPAHEEATPIDNLEIIVNRFRTTFSSVLSHYLQKSIVVENIESDFLPFSAYLAGDGSQNAATIIDLAPLKFPCIVSFDAKLSSLLLELMLGGKASPEFVAPAIARSRTKLDLHILKNVVVQLCAALDNVFQPVIPITSSPAGTFATCASISLFEAQTIMALFTLNMSIGKCSGRMDLLFPIKTFDPYRESLASVMQQNSLDQNRWNDSITESLDETAVTLMARTGVLTLSVKQLIEMQPGDEFFIGHEPGTSVDVLVEGVAKFSGDTELHKQRRNIRITSIVT